MDLDEVNKAQVKRLLVFVKGKRERHLRELDLVLKEVKEDRGGETIYNQQDVLGLLDEFHSMCKDLTRGELENIGNMSALYGADLLQQAQSQGLQLCGDVGGIEEESRLQAVADLADWAGTAPVPTRAGILGRLPGAGGSGGGSPQGPDTEALVAENKQLQERFRVMQMQCAELLKERSILSEELEGMRSQFGTMKSQLSGDMAAQGAVREMESQLANTKNLLESKQGEVERIKEDLNKRLIDSNQFKDLKAILSKKNQQIKVLRDRLRKYEPDDDAGLVRED